MKVLNRWKYINACQRCANLTVLDPLSVCVRNFAVRVRSYVFFTVRDRGVDLVLARQPNYLQSSRRK